MEIILVFAILGILMTLIYTAYQEVTGNAARNTHDANLRSIDGAIDMFVADKSIGQGDEINLEDLEGVIDKNHVLIEEGYLKDLPRIPSVLMSGDAGDFFEGDIVDMDDNSYYKIVKEEGGYRSAPIGDWEGYGTLE